MTIFLMICSLMVGFLLGVLMMSMAFVSKGADYGPDFVAVNARNATGARLDRGDIVDLDHEIAADLKESMKRHWAG